MARKNPYELEPTLRLLAKVEKQGKNREPMKTWFRDAVIVPEFIGHTFLVHNGRSFLKVYVTEEMVGHLLGEFSQTRTFKGHTAGKKAAAPAK
jgi:small subunit ribosomal protein S19